MLEVSVNGEVKQLPREMNLVETLQLLEFTQEKIAVAINGEFVPRSTYAERKIISGDQIDIVKPIGGG